MSTPTRMPRYDVRNDGIGPYAVFYCDKCNREFRSQPQIAATIAKDIGRQAAGGLLRSIPLVGGAVANRVAEDPRYTYSLTPQQLDAAWKEVQVNFRQCPTCQLVVCLSDFDTQSGFCSEDSPRRAEIAQAQAQQVGGVLKGIADVFGVGEAIRGAAQAAKTATANMARCPQDGTLAPAGTKFCPECGSPMVQPVADVCPKCGAELHGAKFCPQCGTKIERAPAAPTTCPNCGKETKGAKFCPECGTKVG
jgi:ribosomal protein L32